MFTNENFEEIYIVNKETKEIHGASKLSALCNLHPDNPDGEFAILAAENAESALTLLKAMAPSSGWDFCGHCFPHLSRR